MSESNMIYCERCGWIVNSPNCKAQHGSGGPSLKPHTQKPFDPHLDQTSAKVNIEKNDSALDQTKPDTERPREWNGTATGKIIPDNLHHNCVMKEAYDALAKECAVLKRCFEIIYGESVHSMKVALAQSRDAYEMQKRVSERLEQERDECRQALYEMNAIFEKLVIGGNMSGEIDSEYPNVDANKTLDEMINDYQRRFDCLNESEVESLCAVIRQLIFQRDGALEGYAEETGTSTSELKADYDAELMAMLRAT